MSYFWAKFTEGMIMCQWGLLFRSHIGKLQTLEELKVQLIDCSNSCPNFIDPMLQWVSIYYLNEFGHTIGYKLGFSSSYLTAQFSFLQSQSHYAYFIKILYHCLINYMRHSSIDTFREHISVKISHFNSRQAHSYKRVSFKLTDSLS